VTRVKICGITRIEDAEAAVSLGADAIGFVFWRQSPRAVGVERAAAITRALPPLVTVVGVFVNQSPDEVGRVTLGVGLDAVQLHGQERAEDYVGRARRIIKAVPVGSKRPPDLALGLPPEVTILLDAHDPVRLGGTGTTIDWSVAARMARARRVILSGGLHPNNVRDAILAVRPYAVDVSSGVEVEPGRKDAEKMRALIDAVRQVP
jgi:phosphoribosylanthranilate isomerase